MGRFFLFTLCSKASYRAVQYSSSCLLQSGFTNKNNRRKNVVILFLKVVLHFRSRNFVGLSFFNHSKNSNKCSSKCSFVLKWVYTKTTYCLQFFSSFFLLQYFFLSILRCLVLMKSYYKKEKNLVYSASE